MVSESEETCAICLEGVEDAGACVTTVCGHTFHARPCFAAYVKHADVSALKPALTCPVCRCPLSSIYPGPDEQGIVNRGVMSTGTRNASTNVRKKLCCIASVCIIGSILSLYLIASGRVRY